jgi:asparagine synthase (glutamine-hydrolysing)
VPFVDPVVPKAAFSLKGSEKIHGRRQKVALKDAAVSWLPDEIVNRPKASFSAPLRAWVDHELRPVVNDVLLNGDLVSSGFIRRSALDHLVEDERAGREDRSKQIWQLLTLELWLRNASSLGVGS